MMDVIPIIGTMESYVGDLGGLRGNNLDGLETCSAISWVVISSNGGLSGRRSMSITGGFPLASHISSNILSEEGS